MATTRERVIRPLAEGAPVELAVATEAAAALGISRSLLYRLLARFRTRPRTSTLLPGKPGWTADRLRLSPALEAIIADAIESVYLQPERPRLSDLMRAIQARCHAAGLPAPDRRTVTRRVVRIDERRKTQRRYGAREARQRFARVRASSLNPNRPLQVVQIDHTEVDVMVVDEEHRESLGRPWLTLAIDVATRVIAGFALSLERPSTVSVALAMTHAVLPKEVWLADREIDLPWPVCGIPETLHLDNAAEFHSETLRRAAEEYGITISFRPPAQPHFGGHVERLIGTVMGAVHLLPGSTFSNVATKGAYRSAQHAALTLAELERWIALEIAGTYHHTTHAALGMTPVTAWERGLGRRPHPPRLPTDRQEFFLDFLPGVRRLVRRDGIQLFRLRYWDNVLNQWAGRTRTPMLVKYNPRNLSRIYIRDDQGQHWPIPYRNLGQPAISLGEQRAAVKRLRADGHRAIDDVMVFKSIREQRALVDRARRTTKQRRTRARRPPTRTTVEATRRHETEPDYSDLPPFPVEEWPS